MPYIDRKTREAIDPLLEDLFRFLPDLTERGTKNSGCVVYVIYKMVKLVYGDGNFEVKSNALKVLESAKLEYYRRVMAPYEDGKIREYGDV